MNTAGIMVITLFIFLGVLFFMMRKPKEGDDSSNLVVGDAYKSKKSDRTVENNHVIHTIYKYRENENVWICQIVKRKAAESYLFVRSAIIQKSQGECDYVL